MACNGCIGFGWRSGDMLACKMSALQRILLDAKDGLLPWQRIPEKRWTGIAAKCGPAELEEIHELIEKLVEDLRFMEDGRVEARDGIHDALLMFREIVALIRQRGV